MKNRSSDADRDYGLWLLLGQARDAILKARLKELKQYNISPRQAGVLFLIHQADEKATPAEISRWFLLERSSISELLSRMENKGLVTRVKDLERKNMLRILLTEKGCEAHYQSAKRESIHKIMSFLSDDERQQLELCLQKLRDKALEELD